MTDPHFAEFLTTVVLPAYAEIAESPRMLRDFTCHMYGDAIDDPLHATLVAELAHGRSLGPVLLIEDRDPARRPAPFGGRYVVAPSLRATADGLMVSPMVLYQMQFDRRLHAFQHRYGATAELPVAKVTRAMILNHVLNSFTFFQIHALSPQAPW